MTLMIFSRSAGGSTGLARKASTFNSLARLTVVGVNLAGVEVIIDLTERIEALEQQMKQREQELLAEIERLKQVLAHTNNRTL